MKTLSLLQKVSVFFSCIILAGSLFAGEKDKGKEKKEKEDTRNPIGCYDEGYQFDLKTLHLLPDAKGPKQSMYVLFNKLDKPVTLYQMRDEESSRSMYLNHQIGARQWAVLSTSEGLVKFICTTPVANSLYGDAIDCGQSLQVCEFTNVKYGLNNRGNYWLVNNSSKNGAVRGIVHYGIIPNI